MYPAPQAAPSRLPRALPKHPQRGSRHTAAVPPPVAAPTLQSAQASITGVSVEADFFAARSAADGEYDRAKRKRQVELTETHVAQGKPVEKKKIDNNASAVATRERHAEMVRQLGLALRRREAESSVVLAALEKSRAEVEWLRRRGGIEEREGFGGYLGRGDVVGAKVTQGQDVAQGHPQNHGQSHGQSHHVVPGFHQAGAPQAATHHPQHSQAHHHHDQIASHAHGQGHPPHQDHHQHHQHHNHQQQLPHQQQHHPHQLPEYGGSSSGGAQGGIYGMQPNGAGQNAAFYGDAFDGDVGVGRPTPTPLIPAADYEHGLQRDTHGGNPSA